jgi:hypothetical protein
MSLAAAIVAAALTGMLALFAAPASAVSATAPRAEVASSDLGTLTSVVSGTFTDAAGVGTFTGTFVPSGFTTDGNKMFATGVLSGNLVSADGTSQPVAQTETMAVNQITAIGCEVLDLTLGPLDLNLLGLVVHLDRVHLNITAVPGAGNLLGNLICAIAGLLDGVGPIAQIVALLNQILALLGL